MSQRDREFDSKQQPNSILTVKWAYKWEVFRRLKALEIPCQCSTNEPLLVQLDSPQAAVQFWSVVRQVNSSRHELISCLDRCWQINCDRKDK
jgi:hypothetical protein